MATVTPSQALASALDAMPLRLISVWVQEDADQPTIPGAVACVPASVGGRMVYADIVYRCWNVWLEAQPPLQDEHGNILERPSTGSALARRAALEAEGWQRRTLILEPSTIADTVAEISEAGRTVLVLPRTDELLVDAEGVTRMFVDCWQHEEAIKPLGSRPSPIIEPQTVQPSGSPTAPDADPADWAGGHVRNRWQPT